MRAGLESRHRIMRARPRAAIRRPGSPRSVAASLRDRGRTWRCARARCRHPNVRAPWRAHPAYSKPQMEAAERREEAPEAEAGGAPLPIREAVLREILASGLTNSTKLAPGAALTLSFVLIRAFVEECRERAWAEAEEAGDEEVQEVHLEKIL